MHSFHSRNVDVLVKALVTFVRALVEYASPVWSLRLARDRAMVERVQNVFLNVYLALDIIIMLKDFSY